MLGLGNFLLFTVFYVIIDGEAVYGTVRFVDGGFKYFLQSGQEVPRWQFIYSGIHSISVWVTVMAVMLAMLTLAKDRIVDSMRSSIIRGRTFITILAVIIILITMTITIRFTVQFMSKLNPPKTKIATVCSDAVRRLDNGGILSAERYVTSKLGVGSMTFPASRMPLRAHYEPCPYGLTCNDITMDEIWC